MKGCEISIENVSKTFGDFHAVDNAVIHIKRGEFFSLLGPSGCGKTTLLRIIAGFEQPDSGIITFDGLNIVGIEAHKRQSNTVFQTYALFPHLSVYENVAFPLRIRKRPQEEIDRQVKEYLHLVQLDAHIYKKPSQLSGGQKQRVAIARALINEPRVLLLDEPLSALDAKLRANLLIELDKLHDQIGITFIFVTHDQSEALSVSDRIAVMNQGKVLQIGSPYEIYEQPATAFVAKFIGETNLFDATVVACEPHTDGFMVTLDTPALGTLVKITDYDKTEVGQPVCFTVRPEKIRISLEKPSSLTKELNVFRGEVEEPVYSGFQSKFYVRLENGALVKVFKQHTIYFDDGPAIQWKDDVYISWAAEDGYIVEDIQK